MTERLLPVVVQSVDDVRARVLEARARGLSVGFVPTMGALHEGHGRLIEEARKETGFVVVSIFVNPTQFGPNEDFSRYPRTFDADQARCGDAGADLIFSPTVATMYPPKDAGLATFVEVPGLSDVLEGASRPGHFRGVATVVLKLFAIVSPDVAYFGAKDHQQQLILRRMTADLNLPLEIRTVPTVREPDGLAMSSRNRYLSPEERRAAVVLSQALAEARAAVSGGERDADRVRQVLTKRIESERLARLDYAAVVDAETLEPVTSFTAGRAAVGLLAVRIGSTRLIDNAILRD
jgi:pantoate--beta-alanine ligase